MSPINLPILPGMRYTFWMKNRRAVWDCWTLCAWWKSKAIEKSGGGKGTTRVPVTTACPEAGSQKLENRDVCGQEKQKKQENKTKHLMKNRRAVGCTPFFSEFFSSILGALRPLPKADSEVEKSKTAIIPDEKSHGLGTQRESPCKKEKWPFFPTILG